MDEGQNIRHNVQIVNAKSKSFNDRNEDFVLEKAIFNNVFEKDIRRVFIYKKAERLAKAIYLIAPAFLESPSLRARLDVVAIALVDAAILPSKAARMGLSRELLTLSSMLSVARTSGLLSSMNADLISRETRALLQEVAEYEEPRLAFGETPTLSDIAKQASSQIDRQKKVLLSPRAISGDAQKRTLQRTKGHIKDTTSTNALKDRREAILSVIRNKKVAGIKDISTLIRDVSEKTIQRELTALVGEGIVLKQGERRWSTYSIV
jgi:DNA-binding transcriptional ArsR family regulator